MMLLIRLLLAHIIGDFFLQSEKWINDKEEKKLKSPILYLHVGIHIILLLIILWDISLWPIILIIGSTHLIIDPAKLILQKKKTKRLLFFLDQILHITIIVTAYFIYTNTELDLNSLFPEQNLLLITCLAFLTQLVSIIMQIIFTKWNISKLTENNESLKDAGKYLYS